MIKYPFAPFLNARKPFSYTSFVICISICFPGRVFPLETSFVMAKGISCPSETTIHVPEVVFC